MCRSTVAILSFLVILFINKTLASNCSSKYQTCRRNCDRDVMSHIWRGARDEHECILGCALYHNRCYSYLSAKTYMVQLTDYEEIKETIMTEDNCVSFIETSSLDCHSYHRYFYHETTCKLEFVDNFYNCDDYTLLDPNDTYTEVITASETMAKTLERVLEYNEAKVTNGVVYPYGVGGGGVGGGGDDDDDDDDDDD